MARWAREKFICQKFGAWSGRRQGYFRYFRNWLCGRFFLIWPACYQRYARLWTAGAAIACVNRERFWTGEDARCSIAFAKTVPLSFRDSNFLISGIIRPLPLLVLVFGPA
jgi:hypothetical protein